MDNLVYESKGTENCFTEEAWDALLPRAQSLCRDLYYGDGDREATGWLDPEKSAIQIGEIRKKAEEVRSDGEVFILVGVGGSNQAARAVIKGIAGGRKGPEICYAGNTLSAYELSRLLLHIRNKSVYINVIAKNFETLEPGSHYRALRKVMEKRYTQAEMARRVILTGTRGSRLEEIARGEGNLFLEFPLDIGGRYSAVSPVGLFPMAAAGRDIDALIRGARDMYRYIRDTPDNTALRYALTRYLLYQNNYDIEVLASFEPRLAFFHKWWVQLFGESEGKNGKGIFPAAAMYSEDLHSMGQYLQDGRRNLLETFVSVEDPGAGVVVEGGGRINDGFAYLEGIDFADINRIAEQATIESHSTGGVPLQVLKIKRIDEYYMGQLFYFFMVSCALSGKLLEVNPFDQEGVEVYKMKMFQLLGK
jgi:glucose-6-phosphate isomerase